MKNLYALPFLAAFLLLAVQPTFAQGQRQYYPCYTDEHMAQMEAANPEIAVKRAELEAQIKQLLLQPSIASTARNSKASRIIPTVVHIVHEFGPENGLTNDQIRAGIAQLNLDMIRRNSDTTYPRTLFQSIASDLNLEFRLATRDPDGNPTDGITRIQDPYTVLPTFRDSVKYVRKWPATEYFNIWLVNTIASSGGLTTIAYAQFPVNNPLPWETWGIVSIYNSFTDPSLKHTISHETGHCFNLYHTFQGGCNGGDNVQDTPPSSAATFTCDVTQNTCHNDSPDLVDQIENFMSYDRCQNMFTLGQRARVEAAIAAVPNLRGLFTVANNKKAGVDDSSLAKKPDLIPVADFGTTTGTTVCQGASVPLLNGSYNGDIDNTWTFTYSVAGSKKVYSYVGAAASKIYVTLDSVGDIPIKLVVRNAFGADSITKTLYKVIPNVGSIALQNGVNYVEGFDGTTLNADPDVFKRYTTDGSKSTFALFATSAPGGLSGSHALRVPNSGTGVTAGTPRYLYAPAIDLSGWTGNPKFYFYRALARRTSAFTSDSLAVDWSTNCGLSWSNKKSYVMRTTKSLYTTNSIWTSASNWTPTSANWVLDSIPLIIGGTARKNVRLRFTMVPGNANALYLDNFQIGSTYQTITGVSMPLSPYCASCLGLEVVPNPATNAAVLEIANGIGNNVLSVWDAAGRMVAQKTLAEAGSQSISLQSIAPGLRNGVYMVRLQHGQGQVQKRMVIAN